MQPLRWTYCRLVHAGMHLRSGVSIHLPAHQILCSDATMHSSTHLEIVAHKICVASTAIWLCRSSNSLLAGCRRLGCGLGLLGRLLYSGSGAASLPEATCARLAAASGNTHMAMLCCPSPTHLTKHWVCSTLCALHERCLTKQCHIKAQLSASVITNRAGQQPELRPIMDSHRSQP